MNPVAALSSQKPEGSAEASTITNAAEIMARRLAQNW
jgi:hypothetical protein